MTEVTEIPKGLADRYSERKLEKNSGTQLRAEFGEEYQEDLPQVQSLYSLTNFWHGTGRFQHAPNGEIKDVLGGIINVGAVTPFLDKFDFSKKENTGSISVAPSRMYARDYARMYFPKGVDIENLYGKVWSKRVALGSGVRLLVAPRIFRRMIRDRKQIERDANEWISRVTSEAIPRKIVLRKPLSVRTDIADNYPILFGIKGDQLESQKTPGYLAYERRISRPILISELTHLEVPYANVEQTRQMLEERGISLPVIPIEFGEQYCRSFSFKTLMSGGPLRLNLQP